MEKFIGQVCTFGNSHSGSRNKFVPVFVVNSITATATGYKVNATRLKKTLQAILVEDFDTEYLLDQDGVMLDHDGFPMGKTLKFYSSMSIKEGTRGSTWQ